jgi:para-aminobenzoate synthetase component 1
MESSLRRPELGRYSFLTADPVMIVDLPRNTIDPLNRVQQILSDWGTPRIEGLPPFQGGWAGLLSYELGHSFEQLPDLPAGPIQLPALYLGLYDFVIAWDHVLDSVWLISQGLSTTEPERRMERAEMRTREILQRLPSCGEKHSLRPPINASETLPLPLPNKNSTKAWKRELPGKDWKVPDGFKQVKANICSNFTEQEYLERVRTAVEYINAGDIFQTNLAQQLLLPATRSSLDLYENLAQLNASTFSGYFDLGVAQIISCSPERLVSIRDRELETRPIKGRDVEQKRHGSTLKFNVNSRTTKKSVRKTP